MSMRPDRLEQPSGEPNMTSPGKLIESRLKNLESHLEQENPVLLNTVQSFRTLDRVAYRLGLLEPDDSFATKIPWWPLIAVLGTFSSGKSTFINHYLGFRTQRTGNQAVDDRFTVLCYSHEETPHALPGVALDSDPRFPFYRISNEIEKVATGEGRRIDAYLQLKTCPSENLRGKILIDSPGFDADAQRNSTLRITDHILDLSDLVLVLFDARHPEPGAMQDTLKHLVSDTIRRSDSGKFLYILNQIDTTAKEDNPEEVVAAWQRALGEQGLTAGRFYTIYNPDVAVPIEDEHRRRRFETKRDADLGEIHNRMHQVEIERAYRIVGSVEKTARDIQEQVVPRLREAIRTWRKRVIWGDIVAFGAFFSLLIVLTVKAGYWDGLSFAPPWLEPEQTSAAVLYLTLAAHVLVLIAIHYGVRKLAASSLIRGLRNVMAGDSPGRGDLVAAFRRSTRPWRSIFAASPAGWGRLARTRLKHVLEETDTYVQTLNDRFTNPSGEDMISVQSEPMPARSPVTAAAPQPAPQAPTAPPTPATVEQGEERS